MDALNRLEIKLDKLADDVSEVRQDLREHMRRTLVAEENLELLRDDVRPLQAHVAGWAGAGKLVSVIALVGGLVLGLWKVLL